MHQIHLRGLLLREGRESREWRGPSTFFLRICALGRDVTVAVVSV